MILFLILLTPFVAAAASYAVRKNIVILNVVALAAAVVEVFAVCAAIRVVLQRGDAYAWNGYFTLDALGAVMLGVLAVVGAMATWHSVGYLQAEVTKGIIGFRRVRQYFALLHLFMAAMFIAVMTSSPVLMWIAIEATTLSTAFLVSFYNKPSSMEAAWKYLLVNSVGLLLAFFGTLLFLYPSVHAGYSGLIDWQMLLHYAAGSDPFVVQVAFVFILIGYGTKVGLVPMHTWLPDAHSKAPAPISSLLSGVLLNVAFLAILRFKVVSDAAVGPDFSRELLITFGVLSLAVAAFMMFNQKNYKRLLAYSSVEHMGIVALGFGFGGAGAFAGLLHIIYHALTKSLLFLSAGAIFLKYGSTKIQNVRGVFAVMPATALLFIAGFLAITGVPPFGIFITEFAIMAAGIGAHPMVVVIALTALALVFASFLRQVSDMMFGAAPEPAPAGITGGVWTITPVIVLFVALITLSLFIPSGLRTLLTAASAVY